MSESDAFWQASFDKGVGGRNKEPATFTSGAPLANLASKVSFTFLLLWRLLLLYLSEIDAVEKENMEMVSFNSRPKVTWRRKIKTNIIKSWHAPCPTSHQQLKSFVGSVVGWCWCLCCWNTYRTTHTGVLCLNAIQSP